MNTIKTPHPPGQADGEIQGCGLGQDRPPVKRTETYLDAGTVSASPVPKCIVA